MEKQSYKRKMLKDAVNINKEVYGGKESGFKERVRKLSVYIRYFVKIYLQNKVVLPYFEIVVTTKCSLNCKDCGSIIPYYSNPYFVKLAQIEKTLGKLFECIDEVRLFGVIGGETFLYPELEKVLENLISRKQVGSIRVFTNAVVNNPLEDTLIEKLIEPKVHVSISNYDLPSTYTFCKYLRAENIDVRMGAKMEWLDRGDMKCRNRDTEQLIEQFEKCYMKTCKSLLNGKFYYCPRSGHAHDMGLVETPEDDYVDLFCESGDITGKILHLYYAKDYLAVCNYCDVGTKRCIPIPAALQLTPEEKKKVIENSKR